MPNLPTHFSFALDTLAALDDPSIKANLGSFLLGSTTPRHSSAHQVEAVPHPLRLPLSRKGWRWRGGAVPLQS